MKTALLLLISTVGAASNGATIDTFDYSSTQASQKVWQPQWESCQTKSVPSADGRVLQLDIPFSQNTSLERGTIDREIEHNFLAPSQFQIDVKLLSESAGERLNLYFHSGEGWYTTGDYITSSKRSGSKMQWQTLTFLKSDFQNEGKPSSWSKVDKIRLSLWSEGKHDVSLQLRNFRAVLSNIAIIVPDSNVGTKKTSHDVAETFRKLLSQMNASSDLITESMLAKGGLGNRKLAVLPYNPEMDVTSTNVLKNFMQRGGKLFVCYRIPKELESVLGIKQGTYYKPTAEHKKFAAIRFNNKNIDGLPAVVEQASWNITTGIPIGHNAKPFGDWYNTAGKKTPHAAMVMSDRGIFFSHVPVRDDVERKALMLTALLGKLEPAVWQEIVETTLKQGSQIGNCSTTAELKAHVRQARGASGLQELAQADSLEKTIPRLLSKGNGYSALQAARTIHKIRSEAFLKGEPSYNLEARAFWEHAGTGAYPGDWERSIKELKEAGFNMILPNMLWGGSASYASDVLPRSKNFHKYGDQIEQCLKAAKKHGLEVHVWKVNFNSERAPAEFLQQMRREGRLQMDVKGEPTDWLNPAHPKNRELELAAMLEVVRKYDIDGIHFDYIRYPNSAVSFDPYSRKIFEAETGKQVKNWPRDCYRGGERVAEYNNWRAAQITKLVEAVSREARKLKPNIKISAAVFRDYPSCHDSVAQDWPIWAKRGYLDFLCHMDYTGNDDKYADWLEQQRKLVGPNFLLYPGIGASSTRSSLTSDRVAAQIRLTRELKANGFTIFNFNAETAARVLPGLKLGPTSSPARPPHRRN